MKSVRRARSHIRSHSRLTRTGSRLRTAVLGGLLALALLPAARAQAQDATTVILVRHAEKIDDSRDPALSAEGEARAALLATMLADAGIDHIVSTDYLRTRHTVLPLAQSLGLEVGSYDPRDLQATAAQLREWGGTILVSGHSNTTPGLVEALGGDSRGPIDDAEYDRLYVVNLAPDGTVTTTLIRYGELFMNER